MKYHLPHDIAKTACICVCSAEPAGVCSHKVVLLPLAIRGSPGCAKRTPQRPRAGSTLQSLGTQSFSGDLCKPGDTVNVSSAMPDHDNPSLDTLASVRDLRQICC